MFLPSFINEEERVSGLMMGLLAVVIGMWCSLVNGSYHLFPFDLGRKYFTTETLLFLVF